MLHQVGVSFDLYYDARKHKIKTPSAVIIIIIIVHSSHCVSVKHLFVRPEFVYGYKRKFRILTFM